MRWGVPPHRETTRSCCLFVGALHGVGSLKRLHVDPHGITLASFISNLSGTESVHFNRRQMMETGTNQSWYDVVETYPKADKLTQYFSGRKGNAIKISTGTITLGLFGKQLQEFASNPAKFLQRVLEQDGRTVNGVKVLFRAATKKRLSKARGWGFYGKCHWVHIDEPPEDESCWICYDFEDPCFLTPLR